MGEHLVPYWPFCWVAGRTGLEAGPAETTILARVNVALAELMPFKGKEEALARTMREVHEVDLPRVPRRVRGRQLACTWAGPWRWLLETCGSAPMDEIERSLVPCAAVVRQTDGRTLLRMSGRKVREVLRKGVTIDLHPRKFRSGDAALTLVAGMDAHLWQLDETPTYEILINRSVTGSFWDWLESAAAEFGLEAAMEQMES